MDENESEAEERLIQSPNLDHQSTQRSNNGEDTSHTTASYGSMNEARTLPLEHGGRNNDREAR